MHATARVAQDELTSPGSVFSLSCSASTALAAGMDCARKDAQDVCWILSIGTTHGPEITTCDASSKKENCGHTSMEVYVYEKANAGTGQVGQPSKVQQGWTVCFKQCFFSNDWPFFPAVLKKKSGQVLPIIMCRSHFVSHQWASQLCVPPTRCRPPRASQVSQRGAPVDMRNAHTVYQKARPCFDKVAD